MKTLKIYDPAMCCSSGVCGPDVDPELVALASFVKSLDSTEITVERYNLAQEPMAYTMNSTVSKLLAEEGVKVLPLVFIDNACVSRGGYPTPEQFRDLLGITE